LGAAAVWLALILHPQPLFAYSAQRANVILSTRAPMPPQTGPLLDEVVRRISRSPLYDARRTHHVFLCDTRTLFGFLTVNRSTNVTSFWWRICSSGAVSPSTISWHTGSSSERSRAGC
jgi:hypothetical protein